MQKNQHKNCYFFSLHGIKIEQKALIFGKQCINKKTFHKNKRLISFDKVDIRKIVLFKKNSYGEKVSLKYVVGHINETDAFPVSLWIKLHQINGLIAIINASTI